LNANGAQSEQVTVGVELEARGDENALQFSLQFDQAVLSLVRVARGPQAEAAALFVVNDLMAAQGKLGALLALDAGRSFTAGKHQIAAITFKAAAVTTETTVKIEFGDTPIQRLVGSVNATPLNATYEAGNVRIAAPYEADVTPPPNGDNQVNVLDVQRIARLAAKLETAASPGEYQRADCAPREPDKGDGLLNLFDAQQAARYAAQLDQLVFVGGPTAPPPTAAPSSPFAAGFETRRVRLAPATLLRGHPGLLRALIDAAGDENAVSFSLNFDPALLRFDGAQVDESLKGAWLIVNDLPAARGRVGLLLALPAGRRFAAGAQAIVNLRFTPLANGQSASAVATGIGFGDEPVARQMGDANAHALIAGYEGATIGLASAAITNVSAASFGGHRLAADSIIAAFGNGLAASTGVAAGLPLPTELAGTTVRVRDSLGVERAAGLFFVSPTQANYHLPPETAPGEAQVVITRSDNRSFVETVEIAGVSPSLFTANADGHGAAAGVALRVRAGGSTSYEPLAVWDEAQKRFVAAPIDLSRDDEQVFLALYGTGLRGRSSPAAVKTTIGGVECETLYTGAQGDFVGLDQINLRLPADLRGRGEVDLVVVVDGQATNAVKISVR
jgi:uncharacterized protein (TIGR03437 family)